MRLRCSRAAEIWNSERVYFYSKTNQMLNISNLFYFGTTLYIFRTVFPSIIRSLRPYIQHQVYVIQQCFSTAGPREVLLEVAILVF